MTGDLSVWIANHAENSPTKVAIRFEDEEISYRELHTQIEGATVFLRRKHGIGYGDRIAYLGFNTPTCLILLFACARLGALYLPLNWRLALPELDVVLGHANVKVLFSDSAHLKEAEALTGERAGCTMINCTELDLKSREKLEPADADLDVDLEAPLLLVYTSGTTGRPKGVVLTQNALLFNALNSLHMHDLTASDHILTVLPMFHVGGLNIQTTPGLYVGATITLHSRFDPTTTLAAIREDRPSVLVLVPTTIAALIGQPDWQETDLQCLRLVTTGSSIVPHSLIEAWHDRGVPVIQVYGLTETGPVALYQRSEEAVNSVGSSGRGALHTELRIVNDSGMDVEQEESGELLLRGPNLFREYWKDPEATKEAIQDDWFRTGDIGYRDKDGFVYINDRKKDVVISGGENIYPAELEQVLDEIDGITEAAVVGISDEKWGEIPVAIVVVNKGDEITTEKILLEFEGRLARYKHPKAVSFVPSLPRNAMGKVLKHELRRAIKEADIELIGRW